MSANYTYQDAKMRYLHDATYKAIVDSMLISINCLLLTPGELRDAAMLASIMWEERKPMMDKRGMGNEPQELKG